MSDAPLLDPLVSRRGPSPAPLAVGAREAARLLGIGERTLWSLTSPRGPIPCAKVGTRVLYRIADLDAWLTAQTKAVQR